MRSVQYSPAPRWSDPQKPLLEEYRFVPYLDSNADKLQRQACVEPYVQMCSDITQGILSRCYPNGTHPRNQLTELYDISDKPLHCISEQLAENHGLLRTLITVLNSPSDSPSSLASCIQSAQAYHKKGLEADLLNTALFGEDPLRNLMDIVNENTFANKISILELAFEKDGLLLAPWVFSALSIFSKGRKTEYTIAHTFPDCLVTEELCEGMKIVNSSAVFSTAGELAEADLVVARIHTGDFTEFNSLPKKLSSYCRTNAFVLVAMRTELTPAELFLKTASETPFKIFTCEDVKAEFEKNGFRLVAHKSNTWSSLLLFRNCNSPVEPANQEMVTVKRSDLDWVDALKESSLKCQRALPGKNLWLLAEGPGISGIIGLAKCLCEESVGRHIR
ncbi:hypothetical protein HPB48_012213 [Haemaphysalis longicornis]|uniref:Uncharacterized protein n=1 Tax=Haemaphysalis longicornis TaxID=44386 RepID=A0A9J6FSZ1_HAELO|nr:hypothetical protein HPB48_012213 [Haemaphysalis longicornis]